MSVPTGSQGGPFLQPSEYGRNEAGQFATVPYEDVSPNKINALAAQFDAKGFRYRVSHSWAKSRLDVFLSYNPDVANEQAVSLWSYAGTEAQKNLLSAAPPPGVISITTSLTSLNVEVIQKALQGTFPANAPTESGSGAQFLDASTNCFDTNGANALAVYNLMKAGVEDRIVQTPTIRHTQTTSLIYPITLSKTNIGRILTTAKLIADENPPQWAIDGLPTDPPPTFVSGITMDYGWRKGSPHIDQIANQKTQIVQEFQYGLWPVQIDGPFLTA